MNPSEQERLGTFMEDSVFIEKNRTIHKHFVDRLAGFTAFDANLDATYGANWLTAIEKFEEHPSDELMRDEIQVYTDNIAVQHKLCWAAEDDLEYYVKRAFPENERKLREFGFPESRRERERGVLKRVLNLFTMRRVAGDYTAELTAAGMPASVLTNFNTQTGNLADAELEQEYIKRLRIRSTEKRIALYNTVYKYHKRVHEAAQVIYRDKPETRQLFAME